MVRSFLHHCKPGQEGLQVQPHVELGRGLPAAVLGPIYAFGHKGDDRGVQRMDRPCEPPGQLAIAARRAELLEGVLQMSQGLPEKRFHHVAVTVLVGMGKAVAAGRCGSARRGELGTVVRQAVADVVQPNTMAKLCIEQADDMAPWRKGSALALNFVFGGKGFDQPCRNEFTNLLDYRHAVFGWFGFVHRKVSLVGNLLKPTTFLLLMRHA